MRTLRVVVASVVALFVLALPATAQQSMLMNGADTTTLPDGGIIRRVQVDPQGRLVVVTTSTLSDGGTSTTSTTFTDGGVAVSVPYCTVSSSKNTTVGTSSTAVPATKLTDRWYERVCNSARNSGTPIITCTSDGTTPTTASTSAGDSLEVGDCATYTTNSVINCISDTASTAVTSEECK